MEGSSNLERLGASESICCSSAKPAPYWLVILVLVILGVRLSEQTCQGSPNPQSSDSVWIFHQKDFYIGHMNVTVAPKALRIDFIDKNTYLVSRAPTWRVVLFNERTNRAMDMSLSGYLAHTTMWTAWKNDEIGDWPSKYLGKSRCLDQECIKIGLLNFRNDGTLNAQSPYARIHYILVQPTFPKQACQILGKFFHNTTFPGVTLSVKNGTAPTKAKVSGQNLSSLINGSLSPDTFLTTSLIEKKSCEAKYFEYPRKFQTVRKEVDVLVEESKKKEQDDLLQMISQ